MKPSSVVRTLCALVIAALIFTGCEDPYGPQEWVAIPDTVSLYSLSRVEHHNLPSAYDLLPGYNGQRLAVETPGASGNWDFALTESAGKLQLIPSGVIKDLASGAAIALLADGNFGAINKVPGDANLYKESEAVTLEAGKVYAIRSRRFFGLGGSNCVLYGKLAPIEIDTEAGELRFEIIRNPNCNDRSMVPPKSK